MIYYFDANVSLEETNDLGAIGDDDVDVRGRGDPVPVHKGDTLEWTYTYKEGGPAYKVISSDEADIECLRLYGAGGNCKMKVELTFFYKDGGSKTWSWDRESGTANLTIEENDVLGNLQDKVIVSFRIRATLNSGSSVSIRGIDFYWEAGDIEKADP